MTQDCRQRPQRLQELASRVERNIPNHRDPEAFHVEKSEIARELRRLADVEIGSTMNASR
jgi:hypothetical protein